MGAVIVTGVLKTHPIQGDIIHDVEKKTKKLATKPDGKQCLNYPENKENKNDDTTNSKVVGEVKTGRHVLS